MIDKHCYDNATHSFWRATWKRCTRFALESFTQPFNTNVAFGQECQIILNRNGDLVYFMYVKIVLPGLTAVDPGDSGTSGSQFPCFQCDNPCAPCEKADAAALLEYLPNNYNEMSAAEQAEAVKAGKEKYHQREYGAGKILSCCEEGDSDCPDAMCPELGNEWCHWTNSVGHFAISRARLVIGGQTVDELWGAFMVMWEELCGKVGRRLLEMVGRRFTRSQLVCDSTREKTCYVPLPFYFSLVSGNALPLASLAFHGVSLQVEFERLEKLIVVSRPGISVRNAATQLAITAADLKAELEVSYVFLDNAERDRFSQAHFEQLMVQNQHYFHVDSRQVVRIPLSFNHPTLEIIFAIRRQCHERCNNWGNFSGVNGMDPLVDAELLLNTASRFGKKDAMYWRCVVPYQHHTMLPEAFIYCMAFALNPEDSMHPSGSINLSRVDHVELKLTVQEALTKEQFTVIIFARSFNLMRFKEGVAGAAFQ